MRELSVAEIRGVRPPLWALRWAVVVVGFVILFAEMLALPTYDPMEFGRAPIGSVAYLAIGLIATWVGLAIVGWWIPRTALAGYAILAVVIPMGGSQIRVVWWLVAAGCALVWAWLMVTEASTCRSRDTASGVPLDVIEDAPRLPFVPAALLGASLAIGVGGLIWHAADAAGVRAFEARANHITATVVEPDGDDGWVLQVGNAQWTFGPPGTFTPEPGMTVGLLVDPLDEDNAVWLAAPDDPSWLIGIAALAPFGLAVGFGMLRRRRAADALLRHGGPARRIVLRQLYDGGYSVFAPSSPGGVRFELAGPDLVYVPPNRPDLPGYWMDSWQADEDEDEDLDDDEDSHDDIDLSAGPLDPVDLAEWADELQEADGPFVFDEDPPSGPELMTDVHAVLIGPLVEGGPVLLRLEDGRVYLDTLRTVPNLRTSGIAGPPGLQAAVGKTLGAVDVVRDAADTVGEAASKPFREGSGFMTWVRANARALRWLVILEAAVIGWLCGWLIEGSVADWQSDDWLERLSILRLAIALLLPLAAPAFSSGWFSGNAIERDTSGFRTLGWLFDRVVAPGQVVGIAAGRRAVGVQLDDQVLSLDPERFHRDRPADVDAAERLVRDWLAAAAARTPGVRKGGLRPTPGLYGTALVVVWWVAALVLALP